MVKTGDVFKKGDVLLKFDLEQIKKAEYDTSTPVIVINADDYQIETKNKEKAEITPREALDFFYHSFTYKDMREGISDMHCRSDEYLVEELTEERLESK